MNDKLIQEYLSSTPSRPQLAKAAGAILQNLLEREMEIQKILDSYPRELNLIEKMFFKAKLRRDWYGH